MFKKNIQQQNKGFTLIEMLIAVALFTLSLAALMTISGRGLKLAREADKQLVADYLALEAIEYVRNIRDEAFLNSNSFNMRGQPDTWVKIFDGYDGDNCGSEDMPCNLYEEDGKRKLGKCGECQVFINKDQVRFLQAKNDDSASFSISIEKTPYRRYITIENAAEPRGSVDVTVRVSWNGDKEQVAYSEQMFMWQ